MWTKWIWSNQVDAVMAKTALSTDMFAYIHGNIGAVHALGDDFAIVNKDTAHGCLIRGKCQLGLIEKTGISILQFDPCLEEQGRFWWGKAYHVDSLAHESLMVGPVFDVSCHGIHVCFGRGG